MNPRRRGDATRLLILEAAEAGFAEHGYDATGVAEICARAGVSKGAFYHHFPSKEAVFLALLERWLAGLNAQLRQIHATAETAPQALLSIAGMVRRVAQQEQERMPIFAEFWARAARQPEIRQMAIAPYRGYVDFFAEVIEAGVREGTLVVDQPRAAAQTIVSFGVGLLLQMLLDPEGADWGQLAEEGVQLFLRGLQGR